MISSGCFGCCPSKARRTRIRCIDSVMFNHEPPNGVYNTKLMPRANIHNKSSGVLCPARLSKTNNILNGGSSWGNVTRTVSPSCQLSHIARFSFGLRRSTDRGGGGKASTIALSRSFSQGCKIPAWCNSLYPFYPHPPGGRMKQRQQFRRASS